MVDYFLLRYALGLPSRAHGTITCDGPRWLCCIVQYMQYWSEFKFQEVSANHCVP